jgi:DNA repair photolyase
MKRWGNLRDIRLDESELRTNLGKGNFIFVGSSCDMFAERMKHGWIADIIIHCSLYPENKYLFQSKNPALMNVFSKMMPPESVICTTIETNRVYSKIMNEAPDPLDRVLAFGGIPLKKYVTIEPIMDFDLKTLVTMIRFCKPEQVNIGADSGGNHLPEPPAQKVHELIEELEAFTIVKQKKNLKRLWKE